MKGHLPRLPPEHHRLSRRRSGSATLAAHPAAGRRRCWRPFVGGLLPYWIVRRRRNKRLYAFEEQLPEAIDLLGRAIRAGHPLSAGLKMVADETTRADRRASSAAPTRRTGSVCRSRTRILAMADRVSIVDVRILVTAILIQREVGGNLAEVLDNLANVIRVRFTIRRQLRVYTAQGRFSGYVLAVLPIAVGGAIYALNPPYMQAAVHRPDGQAHAADRRRLPDHRLPLDPEDRQHRDLRRPCCSSS